MTTYTITLTGVFDAATEAEALLDFEEWVAQRGTVTQAVVITEPDDGGDPYRPVFTNPQTELTEADRATLDSVDAADWRHEVTNGDTRLGLDDWIAHRDDAYGKIDTALLDSIPVLTEADLTRDEYDEQRGWDHDR